MEKKKGKLYNPVFVSRAQKVSSVENTPLPPMMKKLPLMGM